MPKTDCSFQVVTTSFSAWDSWSTGFKSRPRG